MNGRQWLIKATAAALVIGVGIATRIPAAEGSNAGAFIFKRAPLTSLPVAGYQKVRSVEPALKPIAPWISATGAAVSISDLQGTGLSDDVCLVDPRTNTVTVQPAPTTGDRFRPFVLSPDPLPFSRATMAPMGCLPGDFNEDGYEDLLVYYWGRSPIIFLREPGVNLGPGAFKRQELIAQPQRWYTDTVDQADLTGNGHLDLIVGNYFPDGSRVLDAHANEDPALQMQASMSNSANGGTDHILLWRAARGGHNPSVAYQSAPHAFPAAAARGWTLGIAAQDLTGDMLPDLYLAEDFGPDHLLYNESTPGHVHFIMDRGPLRFSIPKSAALGHDSFKGMGVDFGNIDSDGSPDMFVSNISTQFGLMEGNFAWINTGNDASSMKSGIAPFADQADTRGLARSGWGWDVKFGDFNNSGQSQLIQATGFVAGKVNLWPQVAELATENDALVRHVGSWFKFPANGKLAGNEDPAFFVRTASGRWTNIGSAVIGNVGTTRAVSTADLHGDGRLDFAIAGQWHQSYLFQNEVRHPGRYLELRLLLPPGDQGLSSALRAGEGRSGERWRGSPAIGAEVAVRLPGGRLTSAQVDGGNGNGGVRSPVLHFGLGSLSSNTKLSVTIRWRDRSGVAHRRVIGVTPGYWSVLLGQNS